MHRLTNDCAYRGLGVRCTRDNKFYSNGLQLFTFASRRDARTWFFVQQAWEASQASSGAFTRAF